MRETLACAALLSLTALLLAGESEDAAVTWARIVFGCCILAFLASVFLILLGAGVFRRQPDGLKSGRRPVLILAGLVLMTIATYWAFMSGGALFPLRLPPESWQTVTTKDGVLSAMMPGTPEDRPADSNEGKDHVHSEEWVLHKYDDDYILSSAESIRFQEQPAENLLRDLPKMLMAAARRYGEPALTSETDVQSAGRPGKEWVIEAGGRLIQVRAYLIKGRLYQAMADTGTSDGQRRDVRKFLDSVMVVGGD